MQTLFIIGNGFDLNLGLKTSYKDFYAYYSKIQPINNSDKIIKYEMSQNIETWSDLELALGKHTQNFDNPKDFIDVFENIGDRLAEYIDEEFQRFEVNDYLRSGFINDIVYSYNFLPEREKEEIHRFRKEHNLNINEINIVTFNYSKTIEEITENRFPLYTRDYKINCIEHIHGFTNERMIIGVNDITQISNKAFQQNNELVRILVKNTCNIANRSNVENKFQTMIDISDIYCIFGSSIGETDKIWWEKIGQRLQTDDVRLIVFIKAGDDSFSRRPYKKIPIENSYKNNLLQSFKISESEKDNVLKKIYVVLNCDIFANKNNRLTTAST